MKTIARVFPRITAATPTDELAFSDVPGMFPIDVDEVHISCTFTYDKPRAEQLAEAWEGIAPVKIGGPAYDDSGSDFTPGMYVKEGYTITSRGCPNNCWFCSVPKREGDIRELPIRDGWNVLDSNLLACSEQHIRRVFDMLENYNNVEFTGGFEAARLEWWHVELLWNLRPKQMFFAYDEPIDLEPLQHAGNMLRDADFTRSHLRCYVLIGYPKDTIEAAEKRLIESWEAGFLPMAMLWRNEKGLIDESWATFQRTWARPAIIRSEAKRLLTRAI